MLKCSFAIVIDSSSHSVKWMNQEFCTERFNLRSGGELNHINYKMMNILMWLVFSRMLTLYLSNANSNYLVIIIL